MIRMTTIHVRTKRRIRPFYLSQGFSRTRRWHFKIFQSLIISVDQRRGLYSTFSILTLFGSYKVYIKFMIDKLKSDRNLKSVHAREPGSFA